MPFIRFPDIPPVAGVPPLVRTLAASLLTRTGVGFLLDKFGISSSFLAPVWGLFNSSGAPVFDVETIVSFAIQNSSKTSDFPIEGGSFNTYNKTGSPFEARMRVRQASNQAAREALTTALDAALKSLDTYDIVTPDGVYHNATLTGYDYRRESHEGSSAIIADLVLEEVREGAVAQYATSGGSQNSPIDASEAVSFSGASKQAFGQVQAITPTANQIVSSLRGFF